MSTECPNKWEDGKWANSVLYWHIIFSGDVSSKSKCVAACLKKKGIKNKDFTNVNYMQTDKQHHCNCIVAKDVNARHKRAKIYDTCLLKTTKGLYSWGPGPKFPFLSSI